MEATRGNGYAPAWGSLVMMMMIILNIYNLNSKILRDMATYSSLRLIQNLGGSVPSPLIKCRLWFYHVRCTSAAISAVFRHEFGVREQRANLAAVRD